MTKRGMKSSPQLCPSTGYHCPSCPVRAPFSNLLVQCLEAPRLSTYKVLHHPAPSHCQLTWQVQVMQALLGSRQLSPSATLPPLASTTHSVGKRWGCGSIVLPAASHLPGGHPEGPQQRVPFSFNWHPDDVNFFNQHTDGLLDGKA